MLTIPQNIKDDLKKFYAENPNFVFTDQDQLSLNYYFFKVENIIEIYEKGKTIYDLKNLLDSISSATNFCIVDICSLSSIVKSGANTSSVLFEEL